MTAESPDFRRPHPGPAELQGLGRTLPGLQGPGSGNGLVAWVLAHLISLGFLCVQRHEEAGSQGQMCSEEGACRTQAEYRRCMEQTPWIRAVLGAVNCPRKQGRAQGHQPPATHTGRRPEALAGKLRCSRLCFSSHCSQLSSWLLRALCGSSWVEMPQGEESRKYFRIVIDERGQDP